MRYLKKTMILKLAFLLLITLLLPNSPAFSDSTYRIGPGDVLNIDVREEKMFSGKFRVNNEGIIRYPYLKTVDLAGKTTEEATQHMVSLLKPDYLKDPQVFINVVEYHAKKVKVLGAVKSPGTYTLKGSTRILDIISMVGDKTEASGQIILLIRGGNDPGKAKERKTIPPIAINYTDLVEKGDMSQNLLIEAGDVIKFQKTDEVSVLGNVNQPGPVKFKSGMTLLQAITKSGGPSPTASESSTYIIRQEKGGGSKKIPARLDKIMNQKEKDIELKANDVIVVPESFF
jgi:protein involved in polysaccharide export with SLBB domain